MDPDNLKLILEAFNDTTGDAKWAFIAWLVTDLLKGLGVASVFGYLVYTAGRLITQVITESK